MLRHSLALAFALFSAAAAFAQAAPQTTPRSDFAIRCGRLHVGDGNTMNDVWLVVRAGKVAEILPGGAPAPVDLATIDASDKDVMPGLVVADTDLSGHGDETHNVTPDFVAIDGFDFVRDYRRALSGGVTTVYLAPGRNRLVSGQGSVVKLGGDDIVRRVLSESNCLRVTLGAEANTAPPVFEPTASPSSEDPLLPAEMQVPSTRMSQLNELRRLFAEARAVPEDAVSSVAGSGRVEHRYDVTALRAAAAGRLPLRVLARDASDVRRAMTLAKTFGARLVLENPAAITQVARAAANANTDAVFRLPILPGQSNPGGEDLADKSVVDRPESAAAAVRAGMRIALAPADDAYLRDMLMIAGLAIRHGLTPIEAMRAITADAAAVLGVADRVGLLQPGKDADFVVLSGAPFAIGTFVERTFVDGVQLFERDVTTRMVALRVGRILTVSGPPIRNGVILVENGRIQAVGEDLPIPFGAQVIDLPDGVATPGFVDAYSHVGLSGERIGVPNGAADQLIHEAVRADDPMLAEAAAGGLTTVLVSGRDGGLVSGRVAAIKTAAGRTDPATRDGLVLAPVAAIRFVHDAVGPDAIRALTTAVERGKQYIESWQRYEKALADWKAGKAEKPKEAEPAPAPVDDPISGVWEIDVKDLPIPIPIQFRATLKFEAPNKVTGDVQVSVQGRELPPSPIRSGTFEGGKLTLDLAFAIGRQGGSAKVEATISGDTLTGSFDGGQFRGTVTGRRTSRDTSGSAPRAASGTADGSPQKPKVDESLEPLRLLWEKKIPAIVRVQRAPAIADVMKWFEQQKLPLILADAGDAVDTPELIAKGLPPLLLGPQVLREERRSIVNVPALFADRGHKLAIGTGDVRGARWLPVHAALAVRYGMDPQEALKALTLYPAQMFQLADRIGSIERGKDADLVVFAGGGPFEPTSRIVFVMVNGKVVVDSRREAGK